MIQINLLPEELRKREATPLPRRLAIFFGTAAISALAFLAASQWLKIVPDLAEQRGLTAKKLQELNEKVERDVAPIDRALKTLERRQVVLAQIEPQVVRWAPRLDAVQEVLASELEGVWIEKIVYEEKPPKAKGAAGQVLLERRLTIDFMSSDFSESPDRFRMTNEERIADVARRLSRNPVFNRDLAGVEALSWNTDNEDYLKPPWNIRALSFPITFVLTPVGQPAKPAPPKPAPKQEG